MSIWADIVKNKAVVAAARTIAKKVDWKALSKRILARMKARRLRRVARRRERRDRRNSE